MGLPRHCLALMTGGALPLHHPNVSPLGAAATGGQRVAPLVLYRSVQHLNVSVAVASVAVAMVVAAAGRVTPLAPGLTNGGSPTGLTTGNT